VLLISHLAEHTHNVGADARASFLVADLGPDVQTSARATLLGNARQVVDAALEERYLRFFPEHARYLEIGGFAFWTIEPLQLRFIEGFGSQHWIATDAYLARAEEIARIEASVLEHMNQDHRDALFAYCAHAHAMTPEHAEMIGFDCDGFDIRAGVLSSKDLADLFPRLVHRPHRTYITGVSMGGYVIGRAVEQYPGFFAGALPMCGVLGDQALMDYFTDYQLVAQDLAGVSAYPVPADYLSTTVPVIEARLGLIGLTPTGPDTTNDLGKQLRAITINRSGGVRPGAVASFAAWKDFLFGIAVPASTGTSTAENPGQIAQNLRTVYQPNTPVDVNATVLRVRPQNIVQRVLPTLTQVPKIFGRPSAPVLSLHGLGDLFVPFSNEQIYQHDVRRNSRTRLVVQRAIRTTNHCEYSNTEAGTAWDDLVHWVRTGIRPAGDDVTDAQAVADPNFGCRFSDKAAFTAGTGTRRLYAACP